MRIPQVFHGPLGTLRRRGLHDQQMRAPLVGFHHFLQNRRQVGWRLAIDSDTLLPLRSDTNIFTQNTYTYYIYIFKKYILSCRYVNLIETVVECVCARVCVFVYVCG